MLCNLPEVIRKQKVYAHAPYANQYKMLSDSNTNDEN